MFIAANPECQKVQKIAILQQLNFAIKRVISSLHQL